MGRELSLKLFRTLKHIHQSLPHVAKHSRFPLSPWSTNMTTSKIFCTLDIRWNNRQLSHYFLVVPDLPHDIYIGADIMVRLNACIDTVNNIIWSPLSHQLTTSVKLENLQSGQTIPDACAMITEQEATIPAYSKSVTVRLNMRPGQTLNSKLSFFQPSRPCLKLGLTLEATPLVEVSSRMCCSTTVWPKTSTFPKPVTWEVKVQIPLAKFYSSTSKSTTVRCLLK